MVAPSMEAQNVELIRTFIEEFTNKKNLDYANQVLAPDIVDNLSGVGVEAFKYVWSGFFSAFPDFHMTSEDLFAIGDIVVNRALMTGTHLGNFIYGDLKIPPTGAQVTMTGISVYQIKEGKVVAHWAQADMEGMMQQLGVMLKTRDFLGWTSPSTVTGAPGDPQANIALVLRETEMWNSMDYSRIGEIYSGQAVFHIPPNAATNLENYQQWANTLFAQFPGSQITYDDIFATGDRVVGRWTMSGTLAPTGRKLTEGGTSILRIADGKVVELWWNSDYLGVKLQAMAPLTAQEMENYLNMDYAIINAHDLATLGLFTTDQFVLDQVAANQVLTGKEALIGLLGALFQAFPDYHIETLRTLASEPAQVMVREIVQTGTHQGEFMGIPPTGKIGALRALIIYEFVGNQLVRETQYADMASLMIQLGVMPAPTIPPLVPSFTLPDPEPTGLSPLEADAEFGARMNRHDAAGIAKMIHPEAKFVSGGIPLDRQGYVALSELYFQGFSDIHEEYTRRIDLGDGWIITENISHGTHDGVFLGIPPTGKTIAVRGVTLFHYDENGLATEGQGLFDQVTLLTQLGILQ